MKKIAIMLSICAATVMVAGEKDYGWEFTPVIGGMTPEGNIGDKTSLFYGVRVAKLLEDSFIDSVEIGMDYAPTVKFKDRKKAGITTSYGNTHSERYFANITKNLVTVDDFSIYGLTGFGYQHFGKKHRQAKNEMFWQYGLGAKYYLTDNFALKTEVADSIGFKKGNHNLLYSLGFAADFGKRYQDVEEVVIEEVVEVTPLCPQPPVGAVLDENGCEKIIRVELEGFKVNSSVVPANQIRDVRKVAEFMRQYPDYKVLLVGNTDSTGPAAFNQTLSEKRAEAVGNILIMNEGIASDRVMTMGVGSSQPVATNSTPEGRAENRRVDAKFRI